MAFRWFIVRLRPRGRNRLLKFFAKRETTGDKIVTLSSSPFSLLLMERRVSTLNTLRSRRCFWLFKS